MDLGELIREIKGRGLLNSLIMELLKDEDAADELSKYFAINNSGLLLKPIGIVRHGLSDDTIRASGMGVDGIIEVFEEFADGLRSIDGFSHLILISLLNKVTREQRRVLVVRPRRLVKFGLNLDELPEVGVFTTDSPHRPNPIGISIIRLVDRNGRFLRVSGLDLFDGTPILDIKPYTPDRSIGIDNLKTPEWYSTLWSRIGGGVI